MFLAVTATALLVISVFSTIAVAVPFEHGSTTSIGGHRGVTTSIHWRTPRPNAVVKGLLRHHSCQVSVRSSLYVKRVVFTLLGKKPKRLRVHRLRSTPVRARSGVSQAHAVFTCKFDTRDTEDGPTRVKATVVDTEGSTSAIRSFTVDNETSEETAHLAPKWFSPTSFWNRKLPGNTPLSPNTRGYMAELTRQLALKPVNINTVDWSAPVYTVGPDQPPVEVTYKPNAYPESPYPGTVAALKSVPIPVGARPAGGEDKHMVIWQPSTDKMWEFWHMEEIDGQWSAQAAGAMEHVSTSPGRYEETSWPGAQKWWGATGTSLPLVGGLITIEELEAHSINHAIAMGIAEPAPGFVWPAQRSDGHNTEPAAIPEGTIFRLPADLDIDSLELPPALRAIAVAAQEYGMVVRDATSWNVTLYGEDPTQFGSNPYPELLETKNPSKWLEQFPWDKLEVIEPGN